MNSDHYNKYFRGAYGYDGATCYVRQTRKYFNMKTAYVAIDNIVAMYQTLE